MPYQTSNINRKMLHLKNLWISLNSIQKMMNYPSRDKQYWQWCQIRKWRVYEINGFLVYRTKAKGAADFIFQIIVLKDSGEQFLYHFCNFLFGCHFNSRKTLNLLLKKYWWKDIAQQVEYWCTRCTICQQSKIPRKHPKAPLKHWWKDHGFLLLSTFVLSHQNHDSEIQS